MKSKEFNKEFPELFDWNSLDGTGSRTTCEVARFLCHLIEADLKTSDRIKTPGLRSALYTLYIVYEEMNYKKGEEK